MGSSIDKAVKQIERNERVSRRQKLFNLISKILSGQIDSEKTTLREVFNKTNPREQYKSPQDRGTFNYGYMESKEMFTEK
ncbi:MAG: hypothetical protein WC942_01150 [Clostridia bacterium]|jgi:hypothetical protein